MKKIFLAVVFLLISTALIAQSNEADVTQNGPDNSATVDQSGLTNKTVLLQEAAVFPPRGMTADIDQVGTSNMADVYQGEFGQHFATVNQNGVENNAVVESFRNNETASILQSGNLNDAYQRLHGNFGETIVEQIGDENISTQNVGIYGTAGIGNSFRGYQTGNRNQLSQELYTNYDFTSANNDAEVHQEGDDNISTQLIGTTSTYSSDNTAFISQEGNLNEATQSLFGDGNNASVTFEGHSNIADQYAMGDLNDLQTVVNGTGNNIDQDANGINNFSYLASSYNTHNNVMKSEQLGTSNKVNSRILGNAGVASSNNDIDIFQDGDQNWSFTYTEGNSNEIDVTQTGTANLVGLNNSSYLGVSQDGDFNDADILQNGNNNQARILQTGDSNMGSITSIGNGHSGVITQTGGMNEAVITQN